MKIVHIAPNAPYNEGWGYQENLLTKYQVKAGHSVTLIVRNEKHENGRLVETPQENYLSPDGFRVVRRPSPRGILPPSLAKMPVYDILCEEKPDLIFFHGLVSRSILEAVKYKKKKDPACVIVQDNHWDDNIGMQPNTLRRRLLRAYYRALFKKASPYVARVYGVTPWRKDYAERFFLVPPEKTDVLIMGADDEKIDFAGRAAIRERIRKTYGIGEGEFLIVTGGKIDKKKKTHLLMQAVNQIEGVRLLVFGHVAEDIKAEFEAALSQRVTHIGWIEADRVYDYFFAADLVLFPGQHSVLWEQAAAAKVPCVFERWEGMEHVNHGGNADFIDGISQESIKEKIEALLFTPAYAAMKEAALSQKTDIYLYSHIAARSTEMVEKEG